MAVYASQDIPFPCRAGESQPLLPRPPSLQLQILFTTLTGDEGLCSRTANTNSLNFELPVKLVNIM